MSRDPTRAGWTPWVAVGAIAGGIAGFSDMGLALAALPAPLPGADGAVLLAAATVALALPGGIAGLAARALARLGVRRWMRREGIITAAMIGAIGVAAIVVLTVRVRGIQLDAIQTPKPGITLRLARAAADRDGDGFPPSLCGAACDCDDADPDIHPAAVDVPDNGVDEDCSGEDLTRRGEEDRQPPAKEPQGDRLSTSRPVNILLITIDALRADHMRSYGYDRETTPHLDRFAADNVRFDQVRSQGPSTRHSFPTLLTGRYFSSLALVKGKKWSRLLPENTTFAEELEGQGYGTRAIVPYFRFKERSGFSQGFDSWTTVVDPERDPVWDPTADLVTDSGLEHLDQLVAAGSPWLLWLHYFDPHGSYIVHREQPSFGDTRVDRYDGELLFTDTHIGRLFAGVRERGLWETTAIIVTSDHGEALGREIDHRLTYHGFSLFDSEIRIPLITHLPGASARVVEQPVGLIDVPATIRDLAGLLPGGSMQGSSLVTTALGGPPPDRGPLIAELPGDRPLIALVEWPHKLIWYVRQNRYSIYDLEADPHEQRDLASEFPELTRRLADRLRLARYDLRKTSKRN